MCSAFWGNKDESFLKTPLKDEEEGEITRLLFYLLHYRKVEVSDDAEVTKLKSLAEKLGFKGVVEALNKSEPPCMVQFEKTADLIQARAMGFFSDKGWFSLPCVRCEYVDGDKSEKEVLSGQRLLMASASGVFERLWNHENSMLVSEASVWKRRRRVVVPTSFAWGGQSFRWGEGL